MKLRSWILPFLFIAFLVTGLTGALFFDHPVEPEDLAKPVGKAIEKILVDSETEAIQLAQHPNDKQLWSRAKHSFFLLDSGRLRVWNNNDFVPDARFALPQSAVQFMQTAGRDYLLRQWPVRKNAQLLLVIPLHKEFTIVNNYLSPEWNEAIFGTPVKISDLARRRGAPVCTAKFGCLFAIESPDDPVPSGFTWFIFSCFLIAITVLVVWVGAMLRRWHGKNQFQKTFFGLAVFLIGMRIVLVEFNFPNTLIKFHLFDPKQFASSSFNASIGDLFLNSLVVLTLSIYLFRYYYKFDAVKKSLRSKNDWRGVGAAVCFLIAFLALLFPYLYAEIIYHNSSISLEITDSLAFEPSRTFAFLSLIAGSITGFLVLHIALRLAFLLLRLSGKNFLPWFAAAALVFLAYFLLANRSYWITLGIGLALMPVLYFPGLVRRVTQLTFRSFLYFLVVIIAFAMQGMFGVEKFQEEKQSEDLFRYGNNFLVEQDVLGEYLLNESIRRIEKDPYIQLRLASPFLSKTSVRQKIKLFYLSSYFDRYDVQVYLYNSRGEPYENVYAVDFETSVRRYQKEAYKTIYPGIYFINTPTAEAAKKYLVIIPVRRFNAVAGYAVLDLTLKKIIPQNVYPELLIDNRFSQYIGSPEISYAWYNQGRLAGSFGDFNYEKNFDKKLLDRKSLYQSGVRKDEFYHVGMEDKKGQQVVVTGLRYPVFFMITNFSFYFIIGLAIILCYLSVAGINSWLQGRRLNYSSRIQLYVYLAFFFPLAAVSVTTLSLISRSNKDRLTAEFGNRAGMLSERISGSLQYFQSGSGETQSDFQNKLIELAKLASADASVYGTNGTRLASSQPAIFENFLVSNLISPVAWHAIISNGDKALIANESIGNLRYNCAYAAINSQETGKLLGILSVPFFSSAASLEKAQIIVLSNILTVFVIIFILFSFLSFYASKGLTFPLRFIAQSLKKTSLTETNPLISWESKDEIGLLANEYNRMVRNLEQSTMDLARSQKESAWREIARQVAHEIKNPLTPMKLTLQQWERSLANGEVSPDKAKKSIALLLAQLETLNDIAGSFSAFARMPSPVLERIEIGALLTQVTQLHASLEEGTVTFHSPAQPIYLMGDEKLLGRVFSNLILNALQSALEGQRVNVDIKAYTHGEFVRIEVADNGRGIEEWVRDRVFLPHFSTKKTGSGLGLAIVRQGIEQSGGSIWFETINGKGTTFFIEFGIV